MGSYKLIGVTKKVTGEERQSLYDYTDLNEIIARQENDFGAQVKNEEIDSVYYLAIDNETGALISAPLFYMSSETLLDEHGELVPIEDRLIKSRVYTHNDYQNDNVAPYDTPRLALGNYHTKLAAAKNKIECNHAVVILINGEGRFQQFENWTR